VSLASNFGMKGAQKAHGNLHRILLATFVKNLLWISFYTSVSAQTVQKPEIRMRLLNARTLQLEEFFNNPRGIPDYAILSHTWGAEEVTLEDMRNGSA
jgi:hypothetical protein